MAGIQASVEAGTKIQKRKTHPPFRGLQGPSHNIDFSTIRPKYEDYLYHLRRTGYTAYNPGFTQRHILLLVSSIPGNPIASSLQF